MTMSPFHWGIRASELFNRRASALFCNATRQLGSPVARKPRHKGERLHKPAHWEDSRDSPISISHLFYAITPPSIPSIQSVQAVQAHIALSGHPCTKAMKFVHSRWGIGECVVHQRGLPGAPDRHVHSHSLVGLSGLMSCHISPTLRRSAQSYRLRANARYQGPALRCCWSTCADHRVVHGGLQMDGS